MSKEVNVVVIGAGRIGQMHARIFARTPRTQLYGVVWRSNRDDWSAISHIENLHVYPKVSDVLVDKNVDAVVIAVSTDAHLALIQASLEYGKKVFCEKPVAFNAEAIEHLAHQSVGLLVQVGFNRRFDPQFARLASLLRKGTIGGVYTYHIYNRDPKRPPPQYIARSGGMLTDFNVHDFDMLRFLSGCEISEIYVRGANLVAPYIGASGDIDTATISIQIENGSLATVESSRETNCGYDQRIEVLGEHGILNVDNIPSHMVTMGTDNGCLRSNPLIDFIARYERSFELQAEAFISAVLGEADCPVGLADAAAAVKVSEAGWRSLKENIPQKL